MTKTIDLTDVAPAPAAAGDDVIEIHRRTLDKLLVSMGIIASAVFLSAGLLLAWGANFAGDYVYDELASQRVFFPSQSELEQEGRGDLVEFADQQVTTGPQAEAYAGYISGHLEKIAGGKTYSEIDDRGAAAAVTEAKANGASAEEVAQLQTTADQLKAQRDTLFKGETLRALLLSAFAWSTIGTIAGIASWVAFAGAAVMAGLSIAGIVHIRRSRARAAA